MPERLPALVLTILAVRDPRRSARFYQDVFGWTASVESPVYVELALGEGRALGLYQREAFARNVGRRPIPVPSGALTPTELYVRFAAIDDVLRRLAEARAPLLSLLAPRDWGDDVAYFADPDGNVVAVARAKARAD